MAAGDRQLAFTTGPVPTSVEVSGPDRVTPKAVNATFDGTGAAGAFLPCLIITGRTGLEVARVPAPEIAAGASAEVSWFPRVAGAAASGEGASWCTATVALAQDIVAGVSSAGYGSLETNDPVAFSLDAAPLPRLVFGKLGTYLVFGAFRAISTPGTPIANPWTTTLQGGPGVVPAPTFPGPLSSGSAGGTSDQVWTTTWLFKVVIDAAHLGGVMNWNWQNLTGATLRSAFGGVAVMRMAD